MAKFKIERVGPKEDLARLVASEKLTPDDFKAIADALGVKPMRARKIGFVAARIAKTQTEIETRWNGKESSITAEPGDWIVTNMSPARDLMRDSEGHLNVYAIRADKFPSLYTRDQGTTDEGDIYRAVSKVETQRAEAGYILLNGNEVYGNAKETFETTYVVLSKLA
jgi:hypothetical protein